MPGPYGSLANPVQLDPFQQITGVHWGSRITHVALSFVVLGANQGALGGACSPIEAAPVTGPGYSGNNLYLVQSEFRFGALNGTRFVHAYRSNRTWSPTTISAEVAGLPPAPDPFGFDPWTWNEPWASFMAESAGASLGIPLPGSGSSGTFAAGGSADVTARAVPFVSDPYCDAAAGGTTMAVRVADIAIGHSTATLNVSGATVVLAGKTFTQVGVKARPASNPPPTSPGDYAYFPPVDSDDLIGEVWVLFAKEGTTS